MPQKFSVSTIYNFSVEKNGFDNFYSEKNGFGGAVSIFYKYLTTTFEIEHHYYSKKRGLYNYDGIYFRLKISKPFKFSEIFLISPSIAIGDNRMFLKGYKGNQARSSESEFFFDYGFDFEARVFKDFGLSFYFIKRKVFTRINLNRSYLGLGISYYFNLSDRIKRWL